MLVGPPRIIFAELKSDRGNLTQEQAEWLAELAEVRSVEAHLWTPADMDAIPEVLR
jgi:hypothetical protein